MRKCLSLTSGMFSSEFSTPQDLSAGNLWARNQQNQWELQNQELNMIWGKRSLNMWVKLINYSRISSGLLARPPWTSRLADPSLIASPRSPGGQGDTRSTRRGPGAWRTGPGRRSRSTTATCTQRARTQGGQLNEISDLCMVHDLFKGQTAGPRLDTWHLEKMKLRNSKLFRQ